MEYHRFAYSMPLRDGEKPNLAKVRDGAAFSEVAAPLTKLGYEYGRILFNPPYNPRQRSDSGKEGKLSYGPYLLISREKGAGGSAVAQLAGKRLGWQVFNNEIVDAIAQKAHVRRELIESLDERDRKTIRDAVGRLLHRQPIGIRGYLAGLQEILLTLGHQGDVVIVGRGAQFVLPSQFGLRVRMVAPVEVRVRRTASEEKSSLKAAQVQVEKSDRERATLARRRFGQNAGDPLNQDITINTAELTVEAATEVVMTALQRKLELQLTGSGRK